VRLSSTGRFRPRAIPAGLGMPGESFEGAAVLEELPTEAALLLWCALRDVDLVIPAEQASSRELFAVDAQDARRMWIRSAEGLDESLREPLEVLTGLLGSSPPAQAQVSAACAEISHWASDAGLGRTAFAASLRAAAASPREPAYAFLAGIMARRIADHPRAEAWLKRSSAIAQRTGDAWHHGMALLGLANLHMLAFKAEPAIARLHQVLTLARRYAVWELRPKAYHDLFCIACTDGTPRQAAAYALAAARGYGRHHTGIRPLAHDLALFLVVQDRAPVALRILRSLDYGRCRGAERLLVLGNIARAAGAAGEARIYFDVWDEFWNRLDGVVAYDRTAEALVSLAWGAAGLRDATRLEVAAREALRIATPRGEMQEVLQAEQMLDSLSNGGFPEPVSRVTGSPDDLQDAVTAAELLLRDLLRCPHVINPNTVSDLVADRIAAVAAGEARGFRKLARLTRATAR
jgi:hypothetical protein